MPDIHKADSVPAAPGETGGRWIPTWAVVLVALIGLGLAALILSRVAGPLYVLLFPVDPPVPEGAQTVEHSKPDKGAEYWVYRTEMPGLEVAAFYEGENSQCWYTLTAAGDDPQTSGVSYSVARCLGQKDVAGLTTSWEVFIAEGYSAMEGPTIFRVYKYGETG
ncbi:MAG: hypothetical protein GXY36_05495 [Chloroflexi bacterium]|nr:hypothetical protein [Chloroflexota bacterium]